MDESQQCLMGYKSVLFSVHVSNELVVVSVQPRDVGGLFEFSPVDAAVRMTRCRFPSMSRK